MECRRQRPGQTSHGAKKISEKLENVPSVPVFRLSRFSKKISEKLENVPSVPGFPSPVFHIPVFHIRTQADAYGIPQPIALATAAQESSFNVNERGGSGEVGLFQIMPSHKNEKLIDASGKSFKLDFAKAADPKEWQYNVKVGLALLKKDYDFALVHAPDDVARATYAHYNAPGHWSQYKQYPKGIVAQHVADWMVHYKEFGGR